MKGAWVNKILFIGVTLPLLVIYLFLHLQMTVAHYLTRFI